MILRQTAAIFHDAYRELNAKKIFWITLILSIVVVIVFAMFGIDDKGVHFLWMTFPGSAEYASNIEPAIFYVFWMYVVGIGMWLTWIAAILALISTASIFPDLLSGGAIDLHLSKPISRLRLFLTKFLTGLLFVAVQVSVFVVGCLLVIGIRAGAWEWSLLLAVPIVLAFFSYLYAICTFFGVLTRSTITALLLTLLAWFCFFGLNQVDAVLISIRSQGQTDLELAQIRVDSIEERIESLQERVENGTANDRTDSTLERLEEMLVSSTEDVQQNQEFLDSINPWVDRIFLVKSFFPKTGETVALLERYTLNMDDIRSIIPQEDIQAEEIDLEELGYAEEGEATTAAEVMPPDVRTQIVYRNRSLAWILGTSFAFSAAVLGLAAFIFCRRDF